ncbi:MAG TPA: ribonuclease P protein component [Gammaproteobacteria bacterium]|jgi:ribonuclease P protein component|nr:ribonuclease P protein component [Gammaproteobacteria bacterium]
MRPASFPRAARLRLPSEFNHVFRDGTRSSDACFVVLASMNGGQGARLGVAVAKKTVAGAAKRSRIKRAVRESFRLNRALLPAVDVVVQARVAARQREAADLRASLDWHWQELIKRCAKS